MNSARFEKISMHSTLDQNNIVRRIVNGNYEYFKIIGYDENSAQYTLETFNALPEVMGLQLETTTQYLIDNFEKLIS